MSERERSATLWAAAAALIACAVTLAYSNSLHNGFHLDDHYGITPNPWIRSLDNAGRFFTDPNTYSTHRENVDYRPLATLSFAVNYAISELRPWSWHVVNLLLHGSVCLSIFALGRALLGTGRIGPLPWLRERDGDWASLAAALLFAVHPVTAGCANYMWARSSLLVAAFLVPATVLYIRAVQHGSAWRYAGALACFALGLLSKPEAVSFLAVAALAEFLLAPGRQGLGLAGRFAPRWGDLRLAPVAAMAAAYVALWARILPPGQSANWSSGLTPGQYLLTQTGAWWYYVGKVVAPVNLIADYAGYRPWRSLLGEPAALLAIAAWAVVLALMILAVRRAAPLVLLAGAFFIHLAPTSSVVPLAEMVNEHRPYLPVTGLFLLATAAVAAAARAAGWRAAPALAAAVLALGVPLTLMTRERNTVFANGRTYWGDVVAKDPASGRAQLNYAMELWHTDPAQAERRMRESIRIWPNWHYGHTNLGLFLAERGRDAEARRSFDEAVRCGPSSAIPTYYRGEFRLKRGDLEGAAADLERAVANASAPVRERAAYAQALLGLHREEEAIQQIEAGRALQAQPFEKLAQPLLERGVARMQEGRLDLAERCFLLAGRLRAGFALPEVNLGILRDFQGRREEARAHHDRAVELAPRDALPLTWRARFREKAGDLPGAIADARAAADLAPGGRPVAELSLLADLLLKAGQHEEAARVIERGERLDPAAFAPLRARLAAP